MELLDDKEFPQISVKVAYSLPLAGWIAYPCGFCFISTTAE